MPLYAIARFWTGDATLFMGVLDVRCKGSKRVGRRKLINAAEAHDLLGLALDEDNLIRHYTIDAADRLECELRRRPHNKLGFAIQLCIIRQTGRLLGEDEQPPSTIVDYVADQLGVDPRSYSIYAHRAQTRFDHSRYLADYLGLHVANRDDRRAALLAATEAASSGDKGLPIATAVVGAFRERKALLPSQHSIEKIGIAARALARRRAETALLLDLDPEKLGTLDILLDVDPAIGQTRFHWLRSAPDAPGAGNLVGLTERIAFLRSLGIDPRLQARIPSGRWDQMIREGDATPAWLAGEFGASRRRATIVAQIIKLGQKLTDDAVMMFIKLIGRLFSQANNRKKQRHMNARMETSRALRLFLETILALQAANDADEDAIEMVNRKVGWHRLLQIKPGLEAMVENGDVAIHNERPGSP